MSQLPYEITLSKPVVLGASATLASVLDRFGVAIEAGRIWVHRLLTTEEVEDLLLCLSDLDIRHQVYLSIRQAQHRAVHQLDPDNLRHWVKQVIEEGRTDPWLVSATPHEKALTIEDAVRSAPTSTFVESAQSAVAAELQMKATEVQNAASVPDDESVRIIWDYTYLVGALGIEQSRAALRQLADDPRLRELEHDGFSVRRHLYRAIASVPTEAEIPVFVGLLDDAELSPLAYHALGALDREQAFAGTLVVLQTAVQQGRQGDLDDVIETLRDLLPFSVEGRISALVALFRSALLVRELPPSVYVCLVDAVQGDRRTPTVSVEYAGSDPLRLRLWSWEQEKGSDEFDVPLWCESDVEARLRGSYIVPFKRMRLKDVQVRCHIAPIV